MTARTVGARYVLGAELGRGGMGVVWLATDTLIGRRVAVKEILARPGLTARERAVVDERVLREARAAGALNHPAAVTVHDVVREDGATFIVLEYVDGSTLYDLVTEGGPLPQERVAVLGLSLLGALEAAHEAGIVHRDIKPGNLMVLPDGRVKLTDFGIARAADDTALTSSGVLIGSTAYLAPERIGGEDATPGSDLWAFGATLFFAVEGRVPFGRGTVAATLHAILTEPPEPERSTGALREVVLGLLTKDPAVRMGPARVRELLTRAPEPVTMPVAAEESTEVLLPPMPSGKRPSWAWTAGALGIVAALVMVFVLTRPSGETTSQAETPILSSTPATSPPPRVCTVDDLAVLGGGWTTTFDLPRITPTQGCEKPPPGKPTYREVPSPRPIALSAPAIRLGGGARIRWEVVAWSTGEKVSLFTREPDLVDIGKPLPSNAENWTTGLVGAKKGSWRLLLLPPQANGAKYELDGQAYPDDVLIILVQIDEVR